MKTVITIQLKNTTWYIDFNESKHLPYSVHCNELHIVNIETLGEALEYVFVKNQIEYLVLA